MQKNPTNLLNLQNLIKRDPLSYQAEFEQQWRHFASQLETIKAKGANFSLSADGATTIHNGPQKEFLSLVSFLAHTAPCYASVTQSLAGDLIEIVSHPEYACTLSSHSRLTLVQALILLQNRAMVPRFTLMPVLFQMFALPDKRLRSMLFAHLVQDIKRCNANKQSIKLNAALQNFIFNLINNQSISQLNKAKAAEQSGNRSVAVDSSVAAKKSLELVVELWRRRVWIDDRCVNVIASACFSPHIRITVTALRFFLGIYSHQPSATGGNNENNSDEDSDTEYQKKQELHKKIRVKSGMLKGITKRTKKREREIERGKKKANKERRGDDRAPQFAPFDLLHDPQTFVERLFARLRSATCSFPVRLLMMQVIARCISHHELILINFYSFLQRYLQPHQRHVTLILTFLAQASHRLVPPDVLRPCLLTLADSFVTDRSSTQVMQIGLNAIREICARQPLVMTRSLLLDLAQYKKHKVKGVMMASRSLIQLFREKAPTLLKRRERGKEASMRLGSNVNDESEYNDDQFAMDDAATDVFGADLLQQMEQEQLGNDEDAWDMKTTNGDEEEDEEFADDDDDADAPTLADVDAFLNEMNRQEGEEEEQFENEIDQELSQSEGEEDENDEDGDFEFEEGEEVEDAENEDGEEEIDEEDEEEADEESERSSKRVKLNSGESAPSGLPFAATRIFTPKDFAMLRELRLKALSTSEKGGNKIKGLAKKVTAKDEEKMLREETQTKIVDVDAIQGYVPHQRVGKADRLASVMEGRTEAKHGAKKEKGGGTTNADKLKSKPFMLVKHSQAVRSKSGQSFTRQQERQVTHIRNLRKAGNSRVAKKKLKAKRGY